MTTIDNNLNALFNDYTDGLTAREDSRAFGAMIEKNLDHWERICIDAHANYVKNSGKRTIYDFGCRFNETFTDLT